MTNIYAEGQLKSEYLWKIQREKEKEILMYKTIDELYLNDTLYYMSKSPLSHFNKFDSVYSEFMFCVYDDHIPIFIDKNYIAKWIILDDQLLLYNVLNHCESDSTKIQMPLVNMERFLKVKFSKKADYVKSSKMLKHGVIPAVWFTDTLFVKKFPDTFVYFSYYNKYDKVLVFDKGLLINSEDVP
jgi:hypothetical protein